MTLKEPQCRVAFDRNFIPRKIEGARPNTGILSLILTTMKRTAEQASAKLQLGSVTGIRSMSDGYALVTRFGKDETIYENYFGVSSWLDAHLPQGAEATQPEYPLLPTVGEMRRLLKTAPGVMACSFQRLSSGNWEHFSSQDRIPILGLEAAAFHFLQIDVLCREHRYPRGRIQVSFESATVWFWVSQMEKLMMILTTSDAPVASIDLTLRCGEGFQLL